jgi:hypothetical protein
MIEPKRHAWVSNRAFERMTGLARVCMVCGLALERGERLVEKVCPGRRAAQAVDRALEGMG